MRAIQQPPIDFQYTASSMDHDQLAKNCTDALCKTVQLSGPLTDRLLDAMMHAVTSLAKLELDEEGAAEMPSVLAAIWSGRRDEVAGVGSLVESVWNVMG